MPYANLEDEKRSQKRRYLANREKRIRNARISKLKNAFGLSEEAYRALYQSQNGRCAICGKTEEEAFATCKRRLFVDHCHVSGRIRGLLCMKCNGGLGMFGDSPEMLLRALDYLRR